MSVAAVPVAVVANPVTAAVVHVAVSVAPVGCGCQAPFAHMASVVVALVGATLTLTLTLTLALTLILTLTVTLTLTLTLNRIPNFRTLYPSFLIPQSQCPDAHWQ